MSSFNCGHLALLSRQRSADHSRKTPQATFLSQRDADHFCGFQHQSGHGAREIWRTGQRSPSARSLFPVKPPVDISGRPPQRKTSRGTARIETRPWATRDLLKSERDTTISPIWCKVVKLKGASKCEMGSQNTKSKRPWRRM